MCVRPASLPSPPSHVQKRLGRWSLKVVNQDGKGARSCGKSSCTRTVLGELEQEPNQRIEYPNLQHDAISTHKCLNTVGTSTSCVAAGHTALPQWQSKVQVRRHGEPRFKSRSKSRARSRVRTATYSRELCRVPSIPAEEEPIRKYRHTVTVRMQLQGQIFCIQCHRDMPMSWVVSECVRCYMRRRGLSAGQEPFVVVRLTRQVSIPMGIEYKSPSCLSPQKQLPSSTQTDHKCSRFTKFVRWIWRTSNSHADNKMGSMCALRLQTGPPAMALACAARAGQYRIAINLSEPIGSLSDNELITVVTVPAK